MSERTPAAPRRTDADLAEEAVRLLASPRVAAALALHCPAARYAADVATGQVIAGRFIRLACLRHLRDLDGAPENGLRFDHRRLSILLRFVGLLRHSKGEWAGQPVELMPWQVFVLGNLFCWIRADGLRRYREAYCEVGRKNGKSTTAAVFGLVLLILDAEGGAEVYCAATKRDQAKLVWEEARRMVLQSKHLSKMVRVFKANLSVEATHSKMEPLGADADTLDGLNPSACIVDELHAHPNGRLLGVLQTATGARRQPLILEITTAGEDDTGVCYEQRSYAAAVLEGEATDETFFAAIYTVDEGDDWADEAAWHKANPNLGVSVKLDDLRRKAAKAKRLPREAREFKIKHLNIWVRELGSWLPVELWDGLRRDVPMEALRGRECYGALDVSSTTDLTSFALVFPPAEPGSRWRVLAWHWAPEAADTERDRRQRTRLKPWSDAGHIELCPGETIEYGQVVAKVLWAREEFDLRRVAYDPSMAAAVANDLMAVGVDVVKFAQTKANYNEPCKELERLLLAGDIEHDGNPVLKWNLRNAVVVADGLGRVMPNKKKSADKIDGLMSLLMALGEAMLRPETQATPTLDVFHVGGGTEPEAEED